VKDVTPRPGRSFGRTRGQVFTRVAVAVFAALATFLMSFLPASANGMTLGNTSQITPCLAAYTSQGFVMATDQGPAGSTWSMLVKVGLINNDNTQYLWFDLEVIDQGTGDSVAFFGDTHYYWLATGQLVQGTMTVYVTGTYELYLYVDNADSQGNQCLEATVGAYYWV
jgi:hypothetical protein